MLNGMLALTLVFIPPVCRVAETATTQVRALDFIEAARASGAGTLTIIRYHVLGNVLGAVFIYASSLISISRLRAFVSWPRGAATNRGLGADAEHAAAVDLRRAGGLRVAGRRDFHHLDLLQPRQRRSARGDGCADVAKVRVMPDGAILDPRDRGGPSQPMLIARELKKHFPVKGARGKSVQAVDGVSFIVKKGETLGVVGESGCGKSTLARLLLHLVVPDEGELVFDGDAVNAPDGIRVDALRRQVQMVFQDSYASLNPRMPIRDSVAFGPFVQGKAKAAAREIARNMLRKVGMDPELFGPRYPHELSGGQKQRVNIARALATGPRMVILDEPVSALDKSVEAQVLNLLRALKR
jgi:ABC-type glutathione transport system ATPase component